MKLRYYQNEAVESLFSYFKNNSGNPIISMPTGTGKSIVIAEFVRRALQLYPQTRIMMLTHVKELIEQNFKELLEIWPTAPAGIYSAGLNRRDVDTNIIYAGIASVVVKSQLFGKIDLIIIDECHLVSPKGTTMYQNFITQLKIYNPLLKVIGLTATPYRLGIGMLINNGLFTEICYDCTSTDAFNKLVAENFLCPLVSKKTVERLNTNDVPVSAGEFVQKDLQKAVDKQEITLAALNEVLEHGDRKHWLVFATGIKHAEHIEETLSDLGVSAVSVHSKMRTKDRDAAIEMFKKGEITALVNNNVLTTGFNFPGIDLIVMLRPTASSGLWVQMLGRGTRPCRGKKNCLVLDFAGNTERLGPINDPLMPRRRQKGKGEAPVKSCKKCLTHHHISALVCSECGEEFPIQIKITPNASYNEVMVESEPRVETFEVSTVTYRKHVPKGNKPPSLKVSYICGLRVFSEWVCLQHPSEGRSAYARKKARDWWMQRDGFCDRSEIPASIDEALLQTGGLMRPKKVRIWVNKKYPEILDWMFC